MMDFIGGLLDRERASVPIEGIEERPLRSTLWPVNGLDQSRFRKVNPAVGKRCDDPAEDHGPPIP
jgi:hypothetical protein